MTEVAAVVGILVLVGIVAAYVVLRRSRGRRAPSERAAAAPAPAPGETHVTLPVDDVDPEAPAVKRLATDAAHRVLAERPDVAAVVVLSRPGRVLARFERSPPETRAAVEFPTALLEPHAPRHRSPGYSPDAPEHVEAPVRFEERDERPTSTLAQRFDLPDAVKARIRDPEDLADIVRAILEGAGVQVTVDKDVLRYGNEVMIVLHVPPGSPVRTDDLNSAYIRFQQSSAPRGIVVTTGRLNSHDLRRRHALAPALRHAGSEGIQRMADAVAMGADPLAFVAEVPVDVR